jgi:hypothetical protein
VTDRDYLKRGNNPLAPHMSNGDGEKGNNPLAPAPVILPDPTPGTANNPLPPAPTPDPTPES